MFLDRLTLKAAEGQDLRDAAGLDGRAVAGEHLDRLVRLGRARGDAAGDDAAEIGIGLQQRADHAERAFLDLGLRHMGEDEIVHRREAVILRTFRRMGHPALLARAVEDREVELLVGGVERGEEVEDLVDDLGGAGVRLVDLVDRDDRLEAELQRLGDHELGLRHRALGRIDQHDGRVDHVQDALDLAAEIGVAWGIDDVDARILPDDRGRLGQDGDAALLLEVVGIHHALDDALVVAVGAGLLQKLVDERGLAMVDVRDDGDVAHGHAGLGLAFKATSRSGAMPRRRSLFHVNLEFVALHINAGGLFGNRRRCRKVNAFKLPPAPAAVRQRPGRPDR